MIKIGILGHSPDSFNNSAKLINNIDDIVSIIKRQYKNESIGFILNGEPGPNQWIGKILMEKSIPFFIYLYDIPEKTSQYWNDEQRNIFNEQLNFSSGVNIYDEKEGSLSRIKRDRHIIEDSSWVVVFWNGKHQGFTYEALKYAIEHNKIVYNALNEIEIMDKANLKAEKDDNERLYKF
jgi:hypothetical protein